MIELLQYTPKLKVPSGASAAIEAITSEPLRTVTTPPLVLRITLNNLPGASFTVTVLLAMTWANLALVRLFRLELSDCTLLLKLAIHTSYGNVVVEVDVLEVDVEVDEVELDVLEVEVEVELVEVEVEVEVLDVEVEVP